MTILSNRELSIINALNKHEDFVNGQSLFQETGIPLRTIQSDMVKFKKLGIVTSSKLGYKLVANQTLNDITVEKKNDEQQILQRLLSSKNKLNIYDLCEEFYLSESSFKSRTKKIEEYISTYHLHLILKNNEIWISGTELEKRQVIRRMIYLDLPTNHSNVDKFSNYFNGLDITQLSEIIVSSINSCGYYIQASYESGLLLGIIIGLYRAYEGIHTPDEIKYNEQSDEYLLASRVCKRFSDHYGRETTKSDISYIARLFQGQLKSATNNTVLNTKIFDENFERKIKSILNSVFEDYMIVCDINPYIDNLSLHVYDLIKRGLSDNYVINSSHVSLKEKCPYIYDVAVNFSKKLEQHFNIRIPDDEIGFLSIHIGMIINQDDTNACVSVLLYITNYHQIADKINNKLNDLYSSKISIIIIDPTSKNLPSQNFDLIITTEQLDIIGTRVIEITPFFSIMDRSNVDLAISKCIKIKEERKNYKNLLSCFTPNLFFNIETITNKAEAIDFLTDKMDTFGITDKGYKQSVLEREELSPTCFFNSFAIPHSIEMNAYKTMIAVLINKKGIKWNDSSVKLCLLVAINKNDKKAFNETYTGIVKMLTNHEHFESLINCKSVDEFIECFNKS